MRVSKIFIKSAIKIRRLLLYVRYCPLLSLLFLPSAVFSPPPPLFFYIDYNQIILKKHITLLVNYLIVWIGRIYFFWATLIALNLYNFYLTNNVYKEFQLFWKTYSFKVFLEIIIPKDLPATVSLNFLFFLWYMSIHVYKYFTRRKNWLITY